MNSSSHEVEFCGHALGKHRHICAFFNSVAEEHRVLGSFIDQPGVEDLIEYETRLNSLLAEYDDPVICCCDLTTLRTSVIIDIMRTHPVAIIGGVLQDNLFFVPPDQFLLELSERRRKHSVSAM